MKRAQTSTEYLIILAVVIVIAMIVVATMGGIPGIGGGASESAVKAELASLKIGVSGYAHDSRATSFEIRNNNPSLIRIDNMSVNNKRCSLYPASAKLRQGEKRKITCYGVVGLGGGDRFDYDFNITYTDMKTSAQYTMDPSVDLVGRIAEGTELHTGQTTCYEGANGATLAGSCTSAHVGQDGYDDGTAKSFSTKSGNVVLDDHTGLYWTTNRSASDVTLAQAEADCVARNSYSQGGYSDWRLPNIVELTTVMNSGATQQGPSSDWVNDAYWSSTSQSDPWYWYLNFDDGYFSGSRTASATQASVRSVCVRGSTTGITLSDGAKSFVDVGDGTVVDTDTGLVWQKGDNGGSVTWDVAVTYCNNNETGGFTDWRLPTASEGATIIDYTEANYKNSAFTWGSNNYWTGTTPPSLPDVAYYVYMVLGHVNYATFIKVFDFSYVRSVRDQ